MSKKVDFESNTLYVNSKNNKYAGHNMYMTDNEDVEVIDDTIARNRVETKRLQEYWASQAEWAERYMGIGLPQNIIDHFIMRSKMTYLENVEYVERAEEQERQWLRDNPPKQEIVEKLYKRFDEVKDKLNPIPTSFRCFLSHTLKPLDGILNHDEFDDSQYDLIMELLFSEYLDIHKGAIMIGHNNAVY